MLLREPQPPPGLLNRSGSPWTLTGPVECAVGVHAGGCEPACLPRRYRPLRHSLLACGVACSPSSLSSGSASPIAMLTPPQARRSGPGGRRPRRGRRRHGQQCFLCRGSRAQCEPRQRFFAARPVSQNAAACCGPVGSGVSTQRKRPAAARCRYWHGATAPPVSGSGVLPLRDGLGRVTVLPQLKVDRLCSVGTAPPILTQSCPSRVFVGDMTAGLLELLKRPETAGKTYEFGGPQVYSFKVLLELLLTVLNRQRLLIPIPFALAEMQAALLELLPNLLLTRDQVRLLKTDKVVSGMEPTLVDLGVQQRPLEEFLAVFKDKHR